MFGRKRIYLDYAATTPLSKGAFKALVEANDPNSQYFGNHSSTHKEGVFARDSLLKIRTEIAKSLEVHKDEIIFTSGSTEGNNLIIQGAHRASIGKIDKPNFITSSVDHSAILEPLKYIEKQGTEVRFLNPEGKKILDLEKLEKAIDEKTVLISFSYVNSETGSVIPVRDVWRIVSKLKKKWGRGLEDFPYIHVDATQAMNTLSSNPHNIGADFLTFDGSKIYGPKGIGVMVALRERKISPIIFGGGQELGLRPGTVSLPLAHSFSKAFLECVSIREKENERLAELQKYFEDNLKKTFSECLINGENEKRAPNFTNICLPKLDAEYAIAQLDAKGVSASSASACQSAGGKGFSYVVEKLENGNKCASSSIRFSFGKETKKSDLDFALKSLKEVFELQKASFL